MNKIAIIGVRNQISLSMIQWVNFNFWEFLLPSKIE